MGGGDENSEKIGGGGGGLKTIAAYNLKVGRCIELNDLMKLLEYQRSGQGHYLTFSKGHSVFKLKACFSKKLGGGMKIVKKLAGGGGGVENYSSL